MSEANTAELLTLRKEVNEIGIIRYYNKNNDLHRIHGPAVIYINGDKEWYLHNKYHRENGPAIEYGDGAKEWWINGNRHKLNGPAVEYNSGYKEWWEHGKYIRREPS